MSDEATMRETTARNDAFQRVILHMPEAAYDSEIALEYAAMTIAHAAGDKFGVDVGTRQAKNDEVIDFVKDMLVDYRQKFMLAQLLTDIANRKAIE